MKKMAKVHSLFRAPKARLAMEELEEASVLADFGIEGCAHAHRGKAASALS